MNETQRLNALHRYGILDTDAEQSFDDITLVASCVCETPIALISLVDENRQWFKSKVGMTESETPRDTAFCAHGILHADVFEVEDAQKDERFASNPIVTGDAKIRFYAGSPLVTSDGQTLGMLCVEDRVPRQLSEVQKKALQALARQVVSQLELRRALEQRDQMEGQSRALVEALCASELSYRRLFEAAQDGVLILEVETGRITDVNPFLTDLLGFSKEEMLGKTVGELSPFKDIEPNQAMLERLQRHGYVRYEDLPLETCDGRKIDVEFVSNIYPVGSKLVIQCNIRDITVRKRAEQEMALLQTCVSKLNDIVIITDADPISKPGPQIIFVNSAFERVTGYSRSEVIGKTPRILQGKKTDRKVRGEIRQALVDRQPIHRQMINYSKSGEEYWVDLDIVPIFDSSNRCTHFAAIERDITAQKRAETVLARLAAIVKFSEDSIIGKDLNGVITSWNRGSEKIYGYTGDEMVGHSIKCLIPPDRPNEEDQMLERIKCGESVEHFETQRQTKDGRLIDVSVTASPIMDDSGAVVGMSKITRDVTEQKRAVQLTSEQAAFLDKARDAIIATDLEDRILFWNRGAERLYGWKRDEVQGLCVSERFSSDYKKFEEVTQLTASKGEWNGELVQLTKEGREFIVESRRTLIRDDEGNPKSMLVINTDVTEKKKIEAQFMRAQRMESIGTLAGGIAHDLNNILAPILMAIEILKSDSDSPQTRRILETIETSARRGADIVRQVLSFARGVEGERVEVQPKHLLKDLEKIIKDTFPKDIRLEFFIPNDTWTILGDPTQVHQILLNLCVNARDAMPNGGTLTVSVENSVVDAQYAAMNTEGKPGRYVQICVTDTGTGIAPDLLEKIFEPFFTTKELSKGTGLGLSTVKAIVKSHEGFINVYSEVGVGTTFRIYLQAIETSPERRTDETQPLNVPRGNGETILVVDDEASILSITGQTLQAHGYKVMKAADGAEALAVYAKHQEEIAVVLTDMMMPVLDGPAFIHVLRRMNPAVSIIGTSGLNAEGTVAKVNADGVKHFLVKPYTAGTLLSTLEEVLHPAPAGT